MEYFSKTYSMNQHGVRRVRNLLLTLFLTGWAMSGLATTHQNAAFTRPDNVNLSIQQIDDTVVQESSKFFDYYYDAIQKGLSENSIMPYPIELIGEILYRSMVAVMNLISAQPDLDKQEEYIQFGFEIFWNGIKKA